VKLKQKITLNLCFLYVFSVIGIALSMHFCSGKLADVGLYANKTACKFCKKEKQTAENSCCKNTKVEVKVKDDHQGKAAFKLPKVASFAILFSPRLAEIVKTFLPTFFSKFNNKAPPKTKGVAIHLFNCVFRN
jgi:hypothetical protein